MAKAKIALLLVLAAVAGIVAWRFAACEIANLELQSDLQDLSAQVGTRIGLDPLHSDADLRASVIRKAEQYDIPLAPEQITIRRAGSGDKQSVQISVDYFARINLWRYSFSLHFTPSSVK